jgi:invasion protein IalB
MKYQIKRNLKRQAQAILFCAIAMWMLASGLATLPAMAHDPVPPSILEPYSDVVMYDGYAYGTAENGQEAIAQQDGGDWKILCQSDRTFSAHELMDQCNVQIGSARHLKVLKRKGLSHDLYISNL